MTPERRKELIEFLKTNRVPYYLWTGEERAVADKIERKWWLCSTQCCPTFDEIHFDVELDLGETADINSAAIFRLKSEYQDEPESLWTEWSVKLLFDNRNKLRYIAEDPKGNEDGRHLGECVSVEGFGGVLYEDCECESMADAGMTGKFHMAPPIPCEKHGPHKPLKCRFWRQK